MELPSDLLLPALHDPEITRTELARRSLDWFARRMLQVEPARHHRYVNLKLEAVERGEIPRLMLFEPPGHGKSSYASWAFPAWYLGRNPTHNVIAASHTGDFAKQWGRKVRNLLGVPEWPFPGVSVAGDSGAAGEWATNRGGEYFAAGVGSAVTGRRADLAVVDDPVKGREDADSETVRNKLWEWYRADLHTRLKPGAAIILIQTRWHELDLAGRILPEGYDGRSGDFEGRDGERWHVISLPALAEANDPLGRAVGAPLWPEWISDAMLYAERGVQGERNWSALYQQRPSPEMGEFFRRDWFRWYDEPPRIEGLRIYGASDYAITADGGDWTVHGIAGIDADDDLYVLDWWRGRVDPAQAVDAWGDMAATWRPVQWGEDKAQIEKALGPFIAKRGRELGLYVHRQGYPVTADKAMRAQAIRGRASQGKVYLPSQAPWVADLLSELLMFPNGKHDDQVDVLSLFGRMLTTMRPERRDLRLLPKRQNNVYSPFHWRQ